MVDDSAPNRELLRTVLEHCGYSVSEALNGAEAVEYARRHKPDLILMDIQLPVLDGYQAILAIREFASLEEIPAMAVTAYAMIEDEQKAYQSGFNSYMTKPVQLSYFRKEVARLLADSGDVSAGKNIAPGA